MRTAKACVLRLTLLAPEIVEAILDGWQPERMTLPRLMEPFPVGWSMVSKTYCAASRLLKSCH